MGKHMAPKGMEMAAGGMGDDDGEDTASEDIRGEEGGEGAPEVVVLSSPSGEKMLARKGKGPDPESSTPDRAAVGVGEGGIGSRTRAAVGGRQSTPALALARRSKDEEGEDDVYEPCGKRNRTDGGGAGLDGTSGPGGKKSDKGKEPVDARPSSGGGRGDDVKGGGGTSLPKDPETRSRAEVLQNACKKALELYPEVDPASASNFRLPLLDFTVSSSLRGKSSPLSCSSTSRLLSALLGPSRSSAIFPGKCPKYGECFNLMRS
ncbi:hypothetical protein M758_UG245300 [Ceratodon purpureus]|nr:hypothetical protein M758_UG245300 [Ceratodon purpureus]